MAPELLASRLQSSVLWLESEFRAAECDSGVLCQPTSVVGPQQLAVSRRP